MDWQTIFSEGSKDNDEWVPSNIVNLVWFSRPCVTCGSSCSCFGLEEDLTTHNQEQCLTCQYQYALLSGLKW